MPDAEPKRNWFQFSLRLLILVVVAGNVFWWAFNAYRAEQALSLSLANSLAREAGQRQKEAEASKQLVDKYREQGYEHALTASSYKTLAIDAERACAEQRKLADYAVGELQLVRLKFNKEIAALKARLKACGCADK